MDTRRLDTAAALSSGILNLPPPKTDIPRDREVVHAGEDGSFIGVDAVITALHDGHVVESPNYYGIPHVWKVDDTTYRGVLLQYRAVTEDRTFTTVEDAADWLEDRYYATDG